LDGKKNKAVERSKYFIVQTPQCFQSEILKAAFAKGYDASFTDDATVVEAAGYKIHLVEGDSGNIKITTPFDLKLAEALSVKHLID